MSMIEKKGRPYERLIAAVQKKIAATSRVDSTFSVIGKSGSRITLDVAVRATIGSTEMLIAIEAKDCAKTVGVEQVRAFITTIEDARASRGIMISRRGFTRDALLTAAHYGVETSILRRGEGEDWEGFNRALQVEITVMADLYLDAHVVLADGRIILVNEGGMHVMFGDDDEHVFFDHCVNGALSGHPELHEKSIALKPMKPVWEVNSEGERFAVAELRCRRVLVPGWKPSFLHTAPEDCVFAKLTPDGELDERQFFELAELEHLAKEFLKQPAM